MAFDTTRLLAQMYLKGSLPDGRFTPQELMDLAYDSLLAELVPVVLSGREEYYVTTLDYVITAGQASYAVPARALNGVLREVKLIRGSRIIDLQRIDLEDVTDATSGTPNSFYLQGNNLVLYPTPDTTQDTLRVYYFIRPSRLVATSDCGRITAINGQTLTASLPSAWTTANTFDIVRGRADYGVSALDLAASSVDVSAGSVVITGTLPSDLQVGDYLCLAEETCFPFLPPEGHVALTQAAVTSALESMGDAGAVQSAQKSQAFLASFKGVLATRIQGAPKGLSNRLL